jgi:hypothetical protein
MRGLPLCWIALAVIICLLAGYLCFTYSRNQKTLAQLNKHLDYAKLGEPHILTSDDEDEKELWGFRGERLDRCSTDEKLDRFYPLIKKRLRTVERKIALYEQGRLTLIRDLFMRQSFGDFRERLAIAVQKKAPLSQQFRYEQERYELYWWLDIIESIAYVRLYPHKR